jgi:hypothetical protein
MASEQATESNLVTHAKIELRAKLQDDGYDGEIARAVLELIEVFSKQEHSGMSAGFAISTFERLARFEPLGPLTGADDEWNEVGDGVFQNRRCSHVFKQADRFDGQPYDIQGRIFRDPDGSCWQNGDSHVPITFPYTPKTEYVDRPAAATPNNH